MTPILALHLLLSALIVAPVALLFFAAAAPALGLVGPPRQTFYRIHRLRWLFLAVTGLAWAGLVLSWALGTASATWLVGGSVALVLVGAVYGLLLPSHVFRILRRPRFMAAEGTGLSDDQPILGLAAEGPPRAYTLDTLIQPHGAVDTLGDEPLMVTWCSLSHTAVAFRFGPEVSDPANLRVLTALDDNICFYDQGNGNLIQQIEEGVVCGPDTGRRSDTVPVTVTTWGRWQELYPDTAICHMEPRGLRDRLVRRQMLYTHGRLSALDEPLHPVGRPLDQRLPAMTPMLALSLDGEARAWPREPLHERGVLNVEVAGEPLVLLADAEGELAGVWYRRLDGEMLELTVLRESSDPRAVARSADGSRWDLAGRCVDGPRRGARLRSPTHFQSVFWFAWALAYPRTTLESVS